MRPCWKGGSDGIGVKSLCASGSGFGEMVAEKGTWLGCEGGEERRWVGFAEDAEQRSANRKKIKAKRSTRILIDRKGRAKGRMEDKELVMNQAGVN